MATPGRIPLIPCLQAFEALARLRRASAAGAALNVTPARLRLALTPPLCRAATAARAGFVGSPASPRRPSPRVCPRH